jgi:hypothetical protein
MLGIYRGRRAGAQKKRIKIFFFSAYSAVNKVGAPFMAPITIVHKTRQGAMNRAPTSFHDFWMMVRPSFGTLRTEL